MDVQRLRGMGIFGDLIRELRKDRGWSQEVLAQRIRKTKNRVSDIEQMDEPRVQPGTLGALAEAFGLDVPRLRRLVLERRSGAEEAGVRGDDPINLPVPPDIAHKLNADADAAGLSLQEYLIAAGQAFERERKQKQSNGRKLPPADDRIGIIPKEGPPKRGRGRGRSG
jgi:transcriptional regulator with XRE-family HTH domain